MAKFLRTAINDWQEGQNPPSVEACSPTGGYPELESNAGPVADLAVRNTIKLQTAVFGIAGDEWICIAAPKDGTSEKIEELKLFAKKTASQYTQGTSNHRLYQYVKGKVEFSNYQKHYENLGRMWTLLGVVPQQETAQQRATRLALRHRYQASITDHASRFINSMEARINRLKNREEDTVEEQASLRGCLAESHLLQQRLDSPPTCEHFSGQLKAGRSTASRARSTMTKSLRFSMRPLPRSELLALQLSPLQ